jgi:hypothetical protein
VLILGGMIFLSYFSFFLSFSIIFLSNNLIYNLILLSWYVSVQNMTPDNWIPTSSNLTFSVTLYTFSRTLITLWKKFHDYKYYKSQRYGTLFICKNISLLNDFRKKKN